MQIDKKFIAIEGPIGVGKTSLAKKLSNTLDYDFFFEKPFENPFLESFYKEERKNALQTQLFFLFQRIQQYEGLNQKNLFYKGIVSDFFYQKDYLFAELTLPEEEMRLYDQIYKHMTPKNILEPDLVIYLQASPEVLIDRISERGINFEKKIDIKYITKLAELYKEYFFRFDKCPIIIVNSDYLDFVRNEKHYNHLVENINDVKSMKNFLNGTF